MQTPAPLTGLEGIFNSVVLTVIGLAGIVFFIMFLSGGFSYLTAGSDEGKVAGARKTLTYAIFGLVLIAVAYLIIKILSDFTGITGLLHFKIQQ